MPKKRVFTALLVFSLSVLLFFIYSAGVLADCCVYSSGPNRGCDALTSAAACGGVFNPGGETNCVNIPDCNVGCWCGAVNQIGFGDSGFGGSFNFLSKYVQNPSADCNVFCNPETGCTQDLKIICPDNSEKTIATCNKLTGTITITGQNCGTPIAWTDAAKQASGTPEVTVDTCSNSIKDNDETDIDCGGSCSKCADGKSCAANTDCQNNNCVNGACTSNLCGNGVCDTGENSNNCIYDCNVCSDKIVFNEECDSSSCVKGTCGIGCKCDYTCIDSPPAPSNLKVLDVEGEKALSVEWSMIAKSNCELSQILVYRCGEEGNTAECNPAELVGDITLSSSVNYKFPDKNDIKAETMYCYRITAYYKNSGTEMSSDAVCETTGLEKCMEGRSKFCEENTLYACNDENDKETSTGHPCPADSYCLESDDGTAQCVFMNDCDLCNGVFGLFALSGETIRKTITANGGSSYGFYSCKDHEDELKACFFDVTKTNVDKYSNCSDVSSCYSYGSKDACEADKCGAGGMEECEWASSEKAASEFGVGVCRPKDKEKQNCELCAGEFRESKNMFFGTCSNETCKLYGDCYYSDLGGWTNRQCLPKSAVGCTYSAKEDCIGESGEEVIVDATYENGKRTGVTNEITQKSDDYFSFGTCKWLVNELDPESCIEGESCIQESCIKDADRDNNPDCTMEGADYEACIADNKPPTTTLVYDVPAVSGRLLLGDDVNINVETDETAMTYFCFAEGTGACYPNESTACAIQKRFDTETGAYTLYYYSEDLAHNLEEVNHKDVMIDRSLPQVNVIAERINERIYKITMNNGNPEVTCSGHLEDAVGFPLYRNIAVDNEIIAKDSSISRAYTNLPDDRYYFVYECRTLAGNKVKNESMFDVDTNNIHNPQPFGAVKEGTDMISVETDNEAECRYAETTGADQRFADMTPLLPDDAKLKHSSTVSVAEGEPVSYDVKCMFDDGIQGNDGDMIRFAVDNIPPEVTAVSTMNEYVFDDSIEGGWGTRQTLMLKCGDNAIQKKSGSKHMDSGCRETSYSDSAGIIQETTFNGEGPSKLFTIDSSDVITYATTDNNDNSITDGTIDLEISPEPEVDLSVFKSPIQQNAVKLSAVSYGEYIIKVSSTETLAAVKADIDDISIEGKPDIPIRAAHWKTEDSGKVHYFKFSIPAAVPSDLSATVEIYVAASVVKPGEFCSKNIELDENSIQKHISLSFDTSVPTAMLVPDLSAYYGTFGYPLKKLQTENIYYTNQQKLFVSGKRINPATAWVNFYVLSKGNLVKKQYDMASNKDDYEAADEFTGFAGQKPNDYVEHHMISGVLSLIGIPQEDVDNGNVYLDFAGTGTTKIRKEYGRYGEYYNIKSVDYTTGKIALDGKLGFDVSEDTDKVTMHKVPHEKKWFGTYIELERGLNTFYITAESSAGFENINDPDPRYALKYYTIFYDPEAPKVTKQYPEQGTINIRNPVISILIRKPSGSSPLDLGSVKLSLNNGPKTISASNKIAYSSGPYDYYNISYQTTLLDGSYHVKFNGSDYAMNPLAAAESAGPEWVFIVNKDAPSNPIFNVIGGVWHESEGMWYVKESPEFTLLFSEPVNIEYYVTDYVDQSNFDYLSSNCEGKSAGNLFEGCAFDPPLESPQVGGTVEDVHQIVVLAGKVFGDMVGPSSPLFLEPVVIDSIAPSIQEMQGLDKIRENYEKVFKVKVLNEAHELNATLFYPADACLTEDTYELTQISKEGTDYYFKWTIPLCNRVQKIGAQGEKKLNLSIADYAGNSDTKEITTYLDLTPPDIADINLEVKPTRTISIGNYTTKYTDITIKGTFKETDTDVKSVSVAFDDLDDIGMEYTKPITKPKGSTFEIQTRIMGEVNMTIINRLTVYIEDDAGYLAIKHLNVIADMQAPYAIGSSVS